MLAQIDEVLIVGGDDVVNIGARRSELTNPWDSFSFVLGAGILFGGGEGGGCVVAADRRGLADRGGFSRGRSRRRPGASLTRRRSR
jgi:hypothetical protein